MTQQTIRVGTAPDRFRGVGHYLDGDVPLPRDVGVAINEGARSVELLTTDGPVVSWPLDDVRSVLDQGGDGLVLRLKGEGTDRLLVTDTATRSILLARCKNLGVRAPYGKRGRLVGWAFGAIGSVALMILVLIPLMADQLAEYLPPAGEQALGEMTLNQIRDVLSDNEFAPLEVCEKESGREALTAIVDRLYAGSPDAPEVTITVLDHRMINAFALPGGNVVLFRGLLQAGDSAEEIAAVVAHEIGHVAARDPTRIALRSAGSIGVLGLLFGDFAGGAVVLFLANRIIQADYTQEAEAAADVFSHKMLLAADVSPGAIGDFFDSVAPDGNPTDGTFFQHLQSHPEIGDRIQAARDAVPEGAEFEELLTRQQWISLRQMCN